jgi:hypothetical protein
MSRVTAGAPVLGWRTDTTGAQHHLKSSRALYEMPTAMEYLISLLHDACSWEKYEESSNNNAINHQHHNKGIIRDTSQKFGIWGFCRNFLQKYYDSLKRDSNFGEAPQRFLAIIAKFGFFRFFFE